MWLLRNSENQQEQWIVHFKRGVSFIVCKLYLNEAVTKISMEKTQYIIGYFLLRSPGLLI